MSTPASPIIPNVPGLPNIPKQSRSNPTLVIAVLGAATLLFLALWIVALSQASSGANDAKIAHQQGVSEGQATQAKIDEDKLNTLVNSPYKTYVAPSVYGGLEVKYPKTWNAMVTESSSGATLTLILHPDILTAANATKAATRITMTQSLIDTVLKAYQDQIKKGTLKSQTVMVAGISATRVEGSFDGKTQAVITFVPVRDKVITIYCDDVQYISAYNDIVAQFKVNP